MATTTTKQSRFDTTERADEPITKPGAIPRHARAEPARSLWRIDVDAYDSTGAAIAAALELAPRWVCSDCGREHFARIPKCADCGADGSVLRRDGGDR